MLNSRRPTPALTGTAKQSHPTSERIAFLLPNMGGGGAERVALTLIKRFIDGGWPVDLLLMRAEGELLGLVPSSVTVIDLGADRIRRAVRPIARYLSDANPRALQVSMWPLTIAGIIAARLGRTGTQVVVSDHAALSKEYAGRGWAHRQFLRWSIRLLYPRAAARVVVAAETAKDLARVSGLPETAFDVIFNPVDPPEGAADAEADALWEGAGHRILTVGRLSPQKNQALLLDAFARLPADARLVILGEGDLRPALERQADELGIADRVRMPGFRLHPGPVYRSADLFVMSSDFEGYPVAMLEAMHAGLPIVSTDCPSGPAEILDDGEFGLLTPCGDSRGLADAMSAALLAPADPDRIKARAEDLSADAANRYLELMTGRTA